jgi:hypothetical protein
MYMVARAHVDRAADAKRVIRLDELAPQFAEVLTEQARDALRARGIADAAIARLAKRFVAEDLVGGAEDFIEWADAKARG